MNDRIAIVGAGFSGVVLAANLLRRPPADITEIALIEKSEHVARGAAYAAHEFPYLLNVPAGRMSADSSEPLQFLDFARRSLPAVTAEDFLPRRLYGDYLNEFLAEAERKAAPGIRLTHICGEVVALSARLDGGYDVRFDSRESISARRVILAPGNQSPGAWPWAEAVRQHPAYRGNPFDLPANLTSNSVVLVVGNGLTMVDVAYRLTRDGARAPRLVTVSRRGLLPRAQSEFHVSAVQGGGEFVEQARTLRDLVAATRTLADQVELHGGDWREVITFIRNLAPFIWQKLSEADKRRFLRHVQSYWDVHRHRLPRRLVAHIDALRLTGRLDVRAGRIERAVPDGPRLRVTLRDRGTGREENILADAVINATGPDFSLSRSRNPLLTSLHRAGLICADSLELGLLTDSQLACVGRDGTAGRHLFYLGPMLRASYWEATAAAELRNHAERLALHLVDIGERASG